MYGVIDGFNFAEMEAMKYYSHPASWEDKRKKDDVRSKIFSGEWLAAEKKDGFFTCLIIDDDGTVILRPRSRGVDGTFPNKVDWVPQLAPFIASLPKGTCLLGELYFPKNPGSRNVTTVMGCLKEKAIERQRTGDKLFFYVFDCLAYGGKLSKDLGYAKRASLVNTIAEKHGEECFYVEFANYYWAKDLWVKLQEILAAGGEGIVLMHQNGKYEPGKRPSKTTTKVKKELKQTIDCFFTGRGSVPTKDYSGTEIETWQYWEDQITGELRKGDLYKEFHEGGTIIPVTKPYFNHWAGSLEIGVLDDNGKVFPIGWLSGLPEEMKANPKAYAGRPIEVTAMEFDNVNKSLRHGKMVGWRDDLTVKDCLLSKIDA